MITEHLGDGAYVTINRDFVGQVILTANHHDPQYATATIHMDFEAVEALTRLVAQEKGNE
jgi:hypothetical protein